MTTQRNTNGRCSFSFLSPLNLTLLAVNAICFGASLVLLAAGKTGVPLVLVTIGSGLMLLALLTGALVASCRARSARNTGATEARTQGQERGV